MAQLEAKLTEDTARSAQLQKEFENLKTVMDLLPDAANSKIKRLLTL